MAKAGWFEDKLFLTFGIELYSFNKNNQNAGFYTIEFWTDAAGGFNTAPPINYPVFPVKYKK